MGLSSIAVLDHSAPSCYQLNHNTVLLLWVIPSGFFFIHFWDCFFSAPGGTIFCWKWGISATQKQPTGKRTRRIWHETKGDHWRARCDASVPGPRLEWFRSPWDEPRLCWSSGSKKPSARIVNNSVQMYQHRLWVRNHKGELLMSTHGELQFLLFSPFEFCDACDCNQHIRLAAHAATSWKCFKSGWEDCEDLTNDHLELPFSSEIKRW